MTEIVYRSPPSPAGKMGMRSTADLIRYGIGKELY